MLEVIRRRDYARNEWRDRVRIPRLDLPQTEEWCEVDLGGEWQRLRFHDYGTIFDQPGLYEHLFYGLLRCTSPARVASLLADVRRDPVGGRGPLRAIDLGAGNGIVGEELRQIGADHIVGIDILAEARAAADRDRAGLYDDYIVADLCEPTPAIEARLRDARANALVCVAALGFGDIPPLAFYNALRFLEVGGHLAINIKEEFLDERYTFGFSELVRRMVRNRVIRIEATRRYCHRLSARGEPLYYLATVATKLAEVPRAMVVEA